LGRSAAILGLKGAWVLRPGIRKALGEGTGGGGGRRAGGDEKVRAKHLHLAKKTGGCVSGGVGGKTIRF